MRPDPARKAQPGDASPDWPTVAILGWGDLLTDWLDSLGVSLAEFRDEFVGSWMFGYGNALRRAHIRPLIVCVTSRVSRPVSWTHVPTGIPLFLLPTTAASRLLQPVLLDRPLEGRRDPVSVGRAVISHLEPYLATPPLRLARLLRAERCSALLCQEYEAPRFDVAIALGRLLNIPVFATFQGGDYQRSLLERPVRPITLRLARKLIVGSTAEESRLRTRYHLAQPKIARIFNPVDLEFWRADDRRAARMADGIDEDAEVVVWHGQVHPRKGLDVLLDAWKRVCEARPERKLLLLLFGARRGSEWIRDEAERRQISQIRIIDEWILDPARVRRLLSCADIYAFPSRHEGLPVAPIEAMACGLPLVATDAQGVPEITGRGEEDGAILVARDDVVAFGDALGRLLDDPILRADYGARARRRIEQVFDLDSVGAHLRAVLLGDAGRVETTSSRG